MDARYFVYILTNQRHTVLYTGVTNDLVRRLYEHRTGTHKGFTGRYNVTKLVFYEEHPHPFSAIAREKQIKAGSRQTKINLVNTINPAWHDLSSHLIHEIASSLRSSR
jgi:putative endonuclease